MLRTKRTSIMVFVCAFIIMLPAARGGMAWTPEGSSSEMPVEPGRMGELPEEEQVKASSSLQQAAQERKTYLQMDRVIKALNIEPGMIILDIGAGNGFWTFPLADALQGTGTVFATEVYKPFITALRTAADEGGYDNVRPVLIDPNGLDPFYREHSFDIIFLFKVYSYIPDKVGYFQSLRPSLTPETGRLYIISPRIPADFAAFEFGDFGTVMQVIAQEGSEFPVSRRLPRNVRGYAAKWSPGAVVPESIKDRIVYEFNTMLLDRRLYGELKRYYPRSVERLSIEKCIRPRDKELALWLITRLNEDDVFNPEQEGLSSLNTKRLKMLNRIFLTTIFESTRLHEIDGDLVIDDKAGIVRRMKAAGYRLTEDFDFLANRLFLEFMRSD